MSHAAASSSLLDISDPRLRLHRALELDAQGGPVAWGQIKQIRAVVRQACQLDPTHLELAARLFNLYALGRFQTEAGQLSHRVLESGPIDQAMAQQWLLPCAAILVDLTRPRAALEMLDLIPSCYRQGPRWEQVNQAWEAAREREKARAAFQRLLVDTPPYRGEELARYEAETEAEAYPRYEAVAWPYVNRYPVETLAQGCVAAAPCRA